MIDFKRFYLVVFSLIFTSCFSHSSQAQDVSGIPADEVADEAAMVAEDEEVTDDSSSDASELLGRAEAMLAEPDDVTSEQWGDLSRELEAAIPEIAQRQQMLNGDLRQERQEGRKTESVQALLKQKEELELAIYEAIEELPDVMEIKSELDQHHQDLLATMSMRTKVQRFMRAKIQQDISSEAKDKQENQL